MITHFSKNQNFVSKSDSLSKADYAYYIGLKKLLKTSYKKRYSSGLSENQIKLLIRSISIEENSNMSMNDINRSLNNQLIQKLELNDSKRNDIKSTTTKNESDSINYLITTLKIQQLTHKSISLIDSIKKELIKQSGGEINDEYVNIMEYNIVEKILLTENRHNTEKWLVTLDLSC